MAKCNENRRRRKRAKMTQYYKIRNIDPYVFLMADFHLADSEDLSYIKNLTFKALGIPTILDYTMPGDSFYR